MAPSLCVPTCRWMSKSESTRLKIEESLHYLGMIQPLPPPGFRRVADQNWMEAWKQHYKPIAIGQRLMIVPAWLELNKPQRIQVKINPGMAFGTGTHPSTQLCLEFIEGALDPPPSSPASNRSRNCDRPSLTWGADPGSFLSRRSSWARRRPWASISTPNRSATPVKMRR